MRVTLPAVVCLAILATGGRANANPLFATDGGSANDVLATLDTNTAVLTPIGTTGSDLVQGISFAPNGTLFGIISDSGDLVTINTTTGMVATVVGNTGFSGLQGLAFNSNGMLFATEISGDRLLKIDPSTASTTVVGSLGAGFDGITGLAFDGSGTLYGIDVFSGELVTINTSTGAATLVGATGISLPQGLEFDGTGRLFAASTGGTMEFLFQIDPSTGNATQVGSDELDSTNINGLAFHRVPEPTSVAIWSLMGLGGACYAWRRRRRRAEA